MSMQNINDLNVFVKIDGTGEPVVFVHGLGIDHTIWNDQVAYFSKSYETVSYDLRGHGQSDSPETGYSYQQHSDDLGALIEDCLRPPVHLVGLSMGGAVAFHYARQNRDNIRSLTLVGTHINGFTLFRDWPNVYKIARKDGLDAARETWKDFRLFDPLKSDNDKWKTFSRMVDGFSCAPWLDPHPRYDDEDDLTSAHDMTAPALIVSGERDSDFRPISELLALRLPDCRFESYDCGHLVNFEMPGEFNDALTAFLREVR